MTTTYADRRRTENEAAAAANAAAGRPDLTGSPKQIAWAETIRASRIDSLEKIRDYMIAHEADVEEDFKEQYQEDMDTIATTISETRAGWWIDFQDAVTRWIDARLPYMAA